MVAEFNSNRVISPEELDREDNRKPMFYKRSSYLPTKDDKKEK